MSRPTLGLTKLPLRVCLGLFLPEVKRPEHEVVLNLMLRLRMSGDLLIFLLYVFIACEGTIPLLFLEA